MPNMVRNLLITWYSAMSIANEICRPARPGGVEDPATADCLLNHVLCGALSLGGRGAVGSYRGGLFSWLLIEAHIKLHYFHILLRKVQYMPSWGVSRASNGLPKKSEKLVAVGKPRKLP